MFKCPFDDTTFPIIFSNNIQQHTQINKYGFVSLGDPKYHSLWFPNNITTTIYGYLTDLPSTVYYRETDNQTELDTVKKLLQDKGLYTKVTSLVIITFSTIDRPDSSDPHLKTNNFQIAIAARDTGSPFIMLYYQRLDSPFGVVGISIPSCLAYKLSGIIHTESLTLRSTLIGNPGAHGLFASASCKVENTGTYVNTQ